VRTPRLLLWGDGTSISPSVDTLHPSDTCKRAIYFLREAFQKRARNLPETCQKRAVLLTNLGG
jgi:hypothetical protein